MRTLLALLALASGVQAQCEVEEILSGDPDPGDGFGYSISLSGDRLLVGAPYDHHFSPDSGAAYLFERQGTSWTEVGVWRGNGGDALGTCVALDGDRGVIGVPFRDIPGSVDSGAVFVVDRQLDGTWSTTIVEEPGRDIGAAVALRGDRFATKASIHSVRIYELASGLWSFTDSIFPNLYSFGDAVALGDDLLVVGVPSPSPGGVFGGEVRIYENGGGSWVYDQGLSPPGDAVADHFGISLDLEGNLLVVGAEMEGPAGSVYVYRKQLSWLEYARLEPAVPIPGSKFGHSVAVSGSRIVVGAPAVGGGRVYLFEELGGLWIQTGVYSPSDLAAGDLFGNSVDVGDRLFAGAPRDDSGCGVPGCNAGSTYEISTPPDCVVLGTTSCLGTACPCGNDDPQAGCVNSTGQGALLTATGSTSVTSDDLTLVAAGCPPGNSGLFFMGGAVFAPVFVGDGLACTGGLFRFFPSVVSAAGELTLANTVSSAPSSQIHPGDTRHFQAWTRDVLCGPPPAPCATPCGGGSNLSSALSLVFTP